MYESMTVDVSTVLIHMGRCLGERERSGTGSRGGWDVEFYFLGSRRQARHRCRFLFCDLRLSNAQLDALLTTTVPAGHQLYLTANPRLRTCNLRNSSCRLEEFVLV